MSQRKLGKTTLTFSFLVVGGSLAHEAGLAVGDEIISIGNEKLPEYASESLINRILKRQDRFPPPICVISRVQLAQVLVFIRFVYKYKLDRR